MSIRNHVARNSAGVPTSTDQGLSRTRDDLKPQQHLGGAQRILDLGERSPFMSDAILQLQRTCGNRFVNRMVHGSATVQTKSSKSGPKLNISAAPQSSQKVQRFLDRTTGRDIPVTQIPNQVLEDLVRNSEAHWHLTPDEIREATNEIDRRQRMGIVIEIPPRYFPRFDFIAAYKAARFTHATALANLESILKNGLQPGYAGTHPLGATQLRNPDDTELVEDAKKTGVHLADKSIGQDTYAGYLNSRGQPATTLRVFIPQGQPLNHDPQDKTARGSNYPIHPYQIKARKDATPPSMGGSLGGSIRNHFQIKDTILQIIATHMEHQYPIERLRELYDQVKASTRVKDLAKGDAYAQAVMQAKVDLYISDDDDF